MKVSKNPILSVTIRFKRLKEIVMDLYKANPETGYPGRDKRLNKPEFNIMAKKRRAKAKHDAEGRKINQRVARRGRK